MGYSTTKQLKNLYNGIVNTVISYLKFIIGVVTKVRFKGTLSYKHKNLYTKTVKAVQL